MTESETPDSQVTEEAYRLRRLKRRLIGLAIVFFAAFLLSWLLPRTQTSESAVPSVTIPLDGTSATPATPATPATTTPASTPPAEQAQQATAPTSSTPPAKVAQPPAVAPPSPPEPPSAAPQQAPSSAAPVASNSPPGRRWYVQIGSFSQRGNAQTVLDLLRKAGYRVESAAVTADGKTYHRVRLGPYTDETAARQALDKVKRQGYPQSRLTSETNASDPR